MSNIVEVSAFVSVCLLYIYSLDTHIFILGVGMHDGQRLPAAGGIAQRGADRHVQHGAGPVPRLWLGSRRDQRNGLTTTGMGVRFVSD